MFPEARELPDLGLPRLKVTSCILVGTRGGTVPAGVALVLGASVGET